MVNSFFGQSLDSNFKIYLEEFVTSLNDAGIHFTPKLHIVAFHIAEFCDMKKKALGFYSEQASEQVHHAFKRYIIRISIPMKIRFILKNVCYEVYAYLIVTGFE